MISKTTNDFHICNVPHFLDQREAQFRKSFQHTTWLLKFSVLYAHYQCTTSKKCHISHPTTKQLEDECPFFQRRTRKIATIDEAKKPFGTSNTTRRNGVDLLVAVAPPAFVVDTQRAAPAMSLVNLPTSNLQINAPQRTIIWCYNNKISEL